MTTIEFPHQEKDELILLLEKGDFQNARRIADRLLSSGTPLPIINYTASFLMFRYRESQPKKAGQIASHFSGKPYYWDCWLINI